MLAEAQPAEVHQQEAIQEEVQLLLQLILEEVPQLGAPLQGHPQEVRHQDLPLEVQLLVHQQEVQLLDLPLGARHRALQPEVVVPQEEEPPLVPQLGVMVLPVEVVASSRRKRIPCR